MRDCELNIARTEKFEIEEEIRQFILILMKNLHKGSQRCKKYLAVNNFFSV